MPYSAVSSAVQPATLAGLLRCRAAERPDREAFVFLADGEEPGARLTYGELDRRARAIAAALRESLAPGDRALLLYPPGLELIAAFFGCLYAGVTAVPAYPPRLNDRSQSSQNRLRAIAGDAEPRVALTTAALLAAVSAGEGIAERVPELAAVRWIATDGLDADLADAWLEQPEPDPGSVAFLQYTSGSTAAPKGVMVTHANLLHNERMIGDAFRQDEDTVVVGWLPLYHDMGLIGNVLQPLHAGARSVLMAPVAFLQKPLRWLQAISRFGATTSGGPNFAYDLCVRRIPPEQRAELDLSSWRLAFNGAEPVRAETLERFAAAFALCGFDRAAFYPCYGLAEATLFVSGGAAGRFPRVEALDAAALERHEARRVSEANETDEGDETAGDARLLVSSGRAWGGQRLAVVDPETRTALPPGRVGEIWVSGPSVALGYWRNPEATEDDFRARLAGTEEPFLRTGDLGFLRDGELYVTGRLKDLIIIRGRNHYPQDIERTAERSHADLRPGCGAAFAVDAGGEERLVIVQEVERRRREGLDAVITAVRRAVAEEHEVQAQDVVLVRAGTVPKTSSGKIQRRACRAAYLAGGLAVVGRGALSSEAQADPEEVVSLIADRAALLALGPEARRAALERSLRARAAAAVGIAAAAIDPAQPLTGLGLDSLGALELKGGIEADLGVPVPLAELLEGAGTAGLADLLLPLLDDAGEGDRSVPVPLPVELEADRTALSWGQRALWFLHRLAPAGGAYNIAVAARVHGGLDADAFGRALDLLVARHEALRTVFPVAADGEEPVRSLLHPRPAPRPPARPAQEDATGWSAARLDARLAEEAYRPFDLERGPLLRALVLDRADGEAVLLLAVHHIAADFASLAMVARDLGALYRQEAGGPAAALPEPVSYTSHVRREREMLAGPRGELSWDFWRRTLAGERGPVPDLDLPADRQRPPVQTWNGGARTVEIPGDLAGRLRALGSGHGATLFMTLLAAFQAQLGRISEQEDLAVGSPHAGRGAPETSGLVGYLVNPVALRADLCGDPPFAELLARTRAAALAGLEHGEFPFALLAERLRPVRDPSRPPLFQVMFLLQRDRPGDPPGLATFALGESGGRLALGGLELESLRLAERRAQLDLTLRVADGVGHDGMSRLRASLEYNSDLFDGATAERMLGHFRTLLAGAAADPALPVSRLPLLTPQERTEVLAGWNATAAGHRRDLLLHQPFEAQAARTPEAEALVAPRQGSDPERVTYRELSRRANQLARHLQSLGVGPEVRVGVHLARSADLVVSLLAVLKAGGAYVPLDPKYPRERLELMLEDSAARVVIGDGADRGLPGGDGAMRVDLAAERDLLAAYDGSDPPPAALPGSLAYLIYTSGSTGRPKAVAVEHRSAAVLVQWARGVFTPEELAGVLAATSTAFDLSVFELFVPLSWGGRVILAENALELPRLAAAGEVTLVNTVPSAMAELVRAGGVPTSVRTVNLAGEPVPPALVDAVYALPGVERFYNLYGPSEDTTYSTFALLARGEPVSIGRPVDDTVAFVVDRHGEPVPAGVPGELRLGGAGLARGYLGRPELTAESFVPDPFAAERGESGARLYRTGDLVRRRADGRLDFLGRIDHQVKIRGFRVELGEVEAALAAHPGVREAAVLALPEPGGGQEGDRPRRLVAYAVPRGEGLDPAVLRIFLKERLPDAFIPSAWAVLPVLPLSPNGKVDRKVLAAIAPQAPGSGGEPATGPARTAVEEAVAGLFAEALGVPAVDVHDDFFALGGHSLLGTRVLARAARLFAVDLPVSDLFQAPTAAAFAARIAAAAGGAAAAPPVVPVLRPHEERQEGLPISFAQQRLWFLDQLQPGDAAYNMPGAVLLEGPLDAGALAAALGEVARRHESLRTRFAGRGGRPVQIVDPPAPVVLPVVDLAALPETAREAAAAALAAEEAARPFDLARGRLLRALLLRLAPERHLELVTLHHIVADGWSLGVLAGELAALYGAAPRIPLPPLPVQYADFAVWQRERSAGGALAAQLAWWKERLDGAPTNLELPADRPRPAVRTQRGARVHTPLPAEVAAGLRGLGKERGATLFMVLLAGFETLLARLTGQGDLLLGSVVANRMRPELEGLIGLFANTLVLRARLEDDPPFTAALARARASALGAWAHQDLPLEVLVEEMQPEREAGRSPLFQVLLVLQNAPLALALPGLAVRRVPVDSAAAKFDLTLEVTEEAGDLGGLDVTWELSLDLFDPATGGRLAGWLTNLLRGAVAAPGRRLSELPLLGAAERRQILLDWNPPPTRAPLGTPVHRLFEAQAARTPERVAVVAGGETLTYGELNARANRLARRLRSLGVGPETRVGVALERSPAQVTAFLAVLKAGGAYVPLDLSDPVERLAAMEADAEVELLLTEELLAAESHLDGDGAHLGADRSHFGADRRHLGANGPHLGADGAHLGADRPHFGANGPHFGANGPHLGADGPHFGANGPHLGANGPHFGADGPHFGADRPEAGARTAPEEENLPGPDTGTLAYVMFTSGSTGRPKAVAVEHRGIVRLVCATDFAGFGPEQVFLQIAPVAFDASTLEIWGALLHGGRLVLAPGGVPSLDDLGALLERHGVTSLWLTTGLFHVVVEESRFAMLRGLSQILTGGEVISPEAVNRVLAELPGVRLVNAYGPTENTTFTTCHQVREPMSARGAEPIGRPIPGTRVHILDRFLQPVPAGVPGELWTGGEGLARGYLARPDLTAERFLPDPLAGEVGEPGARLYRTGDLARWRPGGADGVLEFLGRADRQVKIRGFRVEPGEVEAVLAGHPGVARAAVLVRGEGAERRVVAFAVPAPGRGARDLGPELRTWLAESLPSWLVPSVVIVPDLPLKPNGKVDRAALDRLAPVLERAVPKGPARPRNPLEELLAGILAEVLGVEQVGIHDDFFALGGHSLLATRALSRIAETVKTELPLSAFFDTPTVAGLAERLLAPGCGAEPAAPLLPAFPLVPVPRDVPLPLSFAQQRLWFLDRLHPGSVAYNLPVAARLTGALDAAVLERCLTEIVRRHEALRTVFAADDDGDGEPVQIVLPAAPTAPGALACLDLSGLPESERLAQALAAASREAAWPFDLETGPVVRFTLLALGPDDHLLAAVFHHIAADGWSLQVFLHELAALYAAYIADPGGRPSPLPELPVQYGDFAVWQRQAAAGPAFARSLAFWRRRLEGAEPLDLPLDRPRGGAVSGPVARVPLDLSARMADSIALRAREAGATRFMVVLCGFLGWLSRLTGQTDLTVGTPVAGRDRTETEGLIGFFANTLPLRARLDGDPTLAELLPRVRAAVLEAYGHGAVPFDRLVEELQPPRAAGRTPWLDAMLASLSQPPVPAIPGLTLLPVDLPSAEAKLDLEVAVYERNGALTGLLEARGDLFEEATLARMAAHLGTLLGGALAEPSRRLSELPLLAPAEREQLAAWGRTAAGGEPGRLVHEAISAQARREPAAVAVERDGEVLTYAELEARANRLAHHLLALGAGAETPVGVCLERSPELMIASLAVLKAGGVYLPVDPGYPRERLELLLADSGARLLVTRSGEAASLGFSDDGACALVLLDRDAEALAARSPEPPDTQIDPQTLAYLVYTSGSTGRPKGVGVSHGALAAHFASAQRAYPIVAGDRFLGFASPGFDTAIEQLLVPLTAGATQVFSGVRLWPPDELSRQTGALGLTVVDLPTAYWSTWALAGGAAAMAPSVRMLLVGGEEMPAATLRTWLRGAPAGVRLVNGYGPTEAVVTATQRTLAAGGGDPGWESISSVPIGRPLPGRTAYVLDAAGGLVPPGMPGELYLGGILARGYHGAPALTAERFVPDPFAGSPGERLYRTGDRVRWRRREGDADLEFLGRLDGQVKIRGFRVEVGEVEEALRSHPGVREAVVLAVPDPAGGRRLAAWVVPCLSPLSRVGGSACGRGAGGEGPAALTDLWPAELAAFLGERLPAHMVPARITALPALPLTAHGKIDRRALAAMAETLGAVPRSGGHTPPRNAVEETLAGLWSELLGVERVGAHDDFFRLGGHSLLATQLTARVRGVFDVDLPLSELFAAPTLEGVARRIEAARQAVGGGAPPLVRRRSVDPAPLSFAQERLWFLHQLEPGSPAYHISGALGLSGPLLPGVLARALERIVARHEVLRTVFAEGETGDPVQRVLPPFPFPVPLIDLSGLPEPAAEAERLGLAAARRLFDLERGPLVRALLLRVADQEHRLAVVIHHIVSDGWSLGVMTGELAALYDTFARGVPMGTDPLPELALQYADFAAWQRSWFQGAVLERQLAWWRDRLADPPLLELPAERPRPPVPSGRGGSLPVVLPADLAGGLNALSREARATLFMTLLGAFAVLLERYSGQDDLTVGSPIANRDRWEIEPLIGCFVNTLPLRLRLAGDPSFRALLGHVRAVTLGAYDHQGVPFEKLVEELAPERDRAHTPLFQVMLVVQNAPQPPLAMGGLALDLRELPTGTAKFDLTLSLAEEGGEIQGSLEYSADAFSPASAGRLLRHFAELLRGAAAAPGRPISDLPLLTAAERLQLLADWNATAAVYAGPPCLHQLVEDQADRTPGAVAVVFEGEELTWRELDLQANRLAHRLRALGAGPDVPVGLCLERSLGLVVSLLAILKAGGAYMPLDPVYPGERLGQMVEDSRTPVIVTESRLLSALPGGTAFRLCLDAEREELAAAPSVRPSVPVDADNLAYVLYTSGSTGRPKGVMSTHGAIRNRLLWMQAAYGLTAEDRVLQKTPFSFDVSVWEFFWPLATGARLVVARPGGHQDAGYLADLIARAGITMLHFVPSMLRAFLAEPGLEESCAPLRRLRRVIASGEALTPDLAAACFARLGGAALHNLYGPTEAAVDVTAWACRPGERTVPIGRPIANVEIHLADRSVERGMRLVPLGVPGELLIGGIAPARGYLGRPDLTAESFVPDPFSGRPGARLYRTGDLARRLAGGEIEYLGRLDHQVKLRGLRIELGEIEAALERHPAVAAAAALVRDDGVGGKLLAAFLVPGEEAGVPDPAELRRFLRRSLPEHMVPTAFAALASFPRTPSGKADRRVLSRLRLEGPAGSAVAFAAPRTPTEELLAALWSEILGRERVGIHDNFFDLGGHSLLATRLVSRVRATFGGELPLARLFDAPTIAELARLLDAARTPGAAARATPIRPIPQDVRGNGDGLPLSFAQERLWFLERMQAGEAVYNVPLAMRLRGGFGDADVPRLAAAFGAIVARHEALRTVFPERDGEPVQRILPPADPALWRLPVADLTALPLPAAEAEARSLAAVESLCPFSLESGPLLRTALLRLEPAEHLLLLDMHHIVSDGWSLGVLLDELRAFYGGDAEGLPQLTVQYADFAVWQREWLRGGELERQTAYWRRQLAGAPAVLELPTDRPRPLVQAWRGAQVPVHLPAALAGRLGALCRHHAVTPFMLLLAAWDLFLHRHSGQRDLNVGSPIAGRNRAETERLIGFFVNTLVLRSTLEDDPPFPELLARTRRTALAAYDHQDLPFEKLVDELKPERSMSHQPLFQVMLALQNAPLGKLELPGGLILEPLDLRAVMAKFDLTLSLMEGGEEISGVLEYNPDLFDAPSAVRLADHFSVLLEGIAADPARPVSALPLLAAAERHQLLAEWADGISEPPGPCLHELFEAMVEADPEALAVVWNDVAWSYGELNRRANRLAWHLAALGVGLETRVGLCVERSAEMLVGMLGVLKAGGAYVPLDPSHPRERLAFMLEDTGARVLVAQERQVELFPPGAAAVVCLDAGWEEIARQPDGNPPPAALGTSAAYVIYTSGSTGTPKGVVTSHDAVVAYCQSSSAFYGTRPGDRALQFSSISFDASVEEIYCCLTRGATLYVRGNTQEGISELLDRCRAQGITLLQFPTAFWNQLALAMEAESLPLPPTVRVIFVGGEKMPARRLVSWWKLVSPGVSFFNAYGPTETTVASTACRFPGAVPVDESLREVPLGRPFPHSRCYVLDRDLRLVPIGVTGELFVGGLSLARGYLDRPGLTAERFIPNPYAGLWGQAGERLYRTGDLVRLLPDGLLAIVGRADGQVKIRGYRIEPGEIEATLARHPGVGQAAVLTREDVPGDVRLVAYVAIKEETEPAPEPEALREYLAERLPSYMVPAAVQVLPALPVSAQGKVDRQALGRLTLDAPRERPAWAAPQNDLEERIAAVWRDLFGLADPAGLGVDDNFFDSGGNSLLLVRLHSRLQTALERNFPLVEIFKHPTIRSLAASLGAGQPVKPSLDKARARTDNRRESMRQLQQLRDQRRGRKRER
jgi:amino acid adenylation domain-containing protein